MDSNHRHFAAGGGVPYVRTDLNVPAGATINILATSFLASQANWNPTRHSDFLELSLPEIYVWFNAFLGTKDGKQNPRIPLGEE
jgi:hypothetical protein